MSKSRNQLLNIVEAVATFLVVFIHFPFPGQVGTITTAIARISVPFFFCVSGYFFYKENSTKEASSIPRKIKHLLLLIIFSELTYYLFYAALQIQNVGFSLRAFANVIISEVINRYVANWYEYIFVFAPPINGICWFIGSLIVVYAIICPIVKYGCQKMALIVSVVLLFAGMLLRRILVWTGVQTIFPYERLLPFLPFPFFVIGYHLRKYKAFCDKIDNKIYCTMLFAGIVLTVAESFTGAHTLYIGTLLLVFVAIAFCGKYSQYEVRTHIGKLFSHIGSSTATYIYILHMMIGNVLFVLVPRILTIDESHWIYQWGIPILICISSALAAEFVVAVKRILCLKRR